METGTIIRLLGSSGSILTDESNEIVNFTEDVASKGLGLDDRVCFDLTTDSGGKPLAINITKSPCTTNVTVNINSDFDLPDGVMTDLNNLVAHIDSGSTPVVVVYKTEISGESEVHKGRIKKGSLNDAGSALYAKALGSITEFMLTKSGTDGEGFIKIKRK